MANQMLEREIRGIGKVGIFLNEAERLYFCLPSELCCLQLSRFTYDTINCATTNLFSLPTKFSEGRMGRRNLEKVAFGAINFYGSLAFALKLEQSIGIV